MSESLRSRSIKTKSAVFHQILIYSIPQTPFAAYYVGEGVTTFYRLFILFFNYLLTHSAFNAIMNLMQL